MLPIHYTGSDDWMNDEQVSQFSAWLDTAVRSTAEACDWVKQQFGLDYSDSGSCSSARSCAIASTRHDFGAAVQHYLDNLDQYRDVLASLMTERFQLFTAA
jgi:hypothetical protein